MKKNIFSIMLLVSLILTSCTKEIVIDLGNVEPELVVEGAITNESKTHTIYLRKTGAYFYNQPAQGVSGAVVVLSDGVGSYALSEDPENAGAYSTASDFAGVVGRTYALSISQVDVNGDGVKEEYTSSSTLLPVAKVDSISVVKQDFFHQNAWAVKMSMQEPPVVKNFYLMRTYRNGICTSDSINEWGVTNDEFFNGKYLVNESVMYFTDRKPDEILVDGDMVSLEVCGISEDYMRFIEEMRDEFRGRNPLFGGQPANVRSNVKRVSPVSTDGKGARGYFAVYAVSWGSTVYRE